MNFLSVIKPGVVRPVTQKQKEAAARRVHAAAKRIATESDDDDKAPATEDGDEQVEKSKRLDVII